MAVEEEPTGFLSRWSRRKRGEELPEPQPDLALPPEEITAEVPLELAPPAEPEFDLASLPPIETLDATSDYTLFFKPGVPAALRTAALRKAWITDPLIRDHMSPLDYAWDFNTPGGLPNGFSNVLAETGEALRKLISQAIGEIEPEEEKPPEIALAEASEDLAAPTPVPEVSVELSPAPEVPVRLSNAPLPAIVAPEEPPLPPSPRRHGGAIPV